MSFQLPETIVRHLVLSVVCVCLAACSSGSGKSLLALEDEKTEIRVALAERIGASPEEVEQALDSTAERQREVAAAVTERVKKRYGTSTDLPMQKHLQGISNALARSMNVPSNEFNVVLLKSNQANAFTPGAGTILVNDGLLQVARNEAEVAAVMAHEMAHVLMKHPQRQKQIRLASKAGSSMMDRFTPEGLQDNIGRFLRLSGNATMNGMIRQQEMMADSIAIDMLVKAGYDPRALEQILRILRGKGPQKDRLTNVVYGNHPLTIDREKAVAAKTERLYRNVSGRFSTPRFDALVKPYHEKRLKRLAARS